MDTISFWNDTGEVSPALRPAHVLVVDDDVDARNRVTDYLTLNDFRVTPADNGKRMMEILHAESIDLVALELKLRDEDGLQLARRLREASRIPIIILTSIAEEADRVMALELGADDYVTKPFSSRELLARIRAVMRRYRAMQSVVAQENEIRAYRFAGWTLNVRLHRLTSQAGERVPITNGEFGLLVAFLGHPERILSRDQLLDFSRLRSTDVYDRSIDIQVLRLRRKLEAMPSRPRLIKTERGLGYRFCAQVTIEHSMTMPDNPIIRPGLRLTRAVAHVL